MYNFAFFGFDKHQNSNISRFIHTNNVLMNVLRFKIYVHKHFYVCVWSMKKIYRFVARLVVFFFIFVNVCLSVMFLCVFDRKIRSPSSYSILLHPVIHCEFIVFFFFLFCFLSSSLFGFFHFVFVYFHIAKYKIFTS